jgi:hypothetical protein
MTELDADIVYNDSELQSQSCLILCIEEHDSKINPCSIDTRLFIGWNNETQEYFLRGKRQDTSVSNFVPYGFDSEFTDDVYEFIEFVLGVRGKKSITLYNFNNINNFSEVTYEFLEKYMDTNYEIVGYDNVKLQPKQVKSQLRLLKKIYNWI